MTPIHEVAPFVYWSDRQADQARDLRARRARQVPFKLGFPFFGLGPTFEFAPQAPPMTTASDPRAEQAESLRTLLSDVTAVNTDANCAARYCGGQANGYWGYLRLPSGEESYAAMFGIEPDTPGERTMLALFGPRANLVDRHTGTEVERGDVAGWSCSSESGQQILLGIGGYDPYSLGLSTDEMTSAAQTAVTILKGQGQIQDGLRLHSGMIGESLVSYLARIYF